MVRALSLLIFFIVFQTPALAVDEPVRDPALLNSVVSEEVVRVGGAKVVLADYELIRRDFPSTRTLSEAEIDAWILNHTAYVSKPQAAQSITNTPIPTTGETAQAYRPAQYGRALVFPVGDEGLIDAKGTGALNPALRGHADGLATLGEAIREFSYEKLVSKVLEHSQMPNKTVGTYAVLDLGFDVKHPDQSQSPAGMILRQSHQRLKSYASLFGDKEAVALEKVFRTYGLTSAGAYRHRAVEMINIQGTPDGDIVDFGGFLTENSFEKPTTNFNGEKVLLDPQSQPFPQPRESLRVPFEQWGYGVSGKADPKLDNPWIWSHELATNLRNGSASRADAEQHLRNLLEPVTKKLGQIRRTQGATTPKSCGAAYSRLD